MKCPQTLQILRINILWNSEINQWQWQEPKSNPLWFVQPKKEGTGLVPTVSWPTAGQQCYSFSLCPGVIENTSYPAPACMWRTTLLDLRRPDSHLRWDLWPVLSCAPIRRHLSLLGGVRQVTCNQALGGPFIGRTGHLSLQPALYHHSVLFLSAVNISLYIILVILGGFLDSILYKCPS